MSTSHDISYSGLPSYLINQRITSLKQITGKRTVEHDSGLVRCSVSMIQSVKHLKNSQQIHYSTDHGSSYADRDRNSPSFFTYFTDAQCVHLW